MPYLLLYDWPGNIRELKNEVKRWVVLSDGPVSLSMLSARILKAADGRKMIGFMDVLSSGGKLTELLDAFEKKVIMEALRTTEGNKVRAAHLLGIGRRTLYEKMEKHHLKDFKISGD
jgi:DNA-binding NtrC family response regulator